VHQSVLRLIMDSLRYWAMECHVDGFRFDLAAALAREFWDVNRLAAFFDVIHQDPVLSQVKLIASRGTSARAATRSATSRSSGRSGTGSTETPCATSGAARPTASATSPPAHGSSDLYAEDGRRPVASINFVTAHDGFTLRDLVSYNEKHNEANLEDSRDGTDDNRSWNCGARARRMIRR
jgi:glycogen operon protein